MPYKFQSILLKEIGVSQTGPFGSQLHEKDYVLNGTPIVTVEHLQEECFSMQNLPMVSDYDKKRLEKFILKEGDIVFSRVGSVDRCTYVTQNEDGWLFSGRCLRIRIDKSSAFPRFINFYFRQKKFKQMMLNISVGATMPSLNTKLMDNICLYLPPIREQTKIANLLENIDNKIILNRRINAELEQIAKTLYEYWFVQFDFPDEKGRPYKSANGKMVYNDILKREIPEGWEVENLANNKLTTILKPGIDKFENEKIYLPTAAITDDKITDRSNIISYENRESRANMQPISNSVWFAKMKKTKKILYFGNYSQKRMNEIILSTGMLGLKCKENSLEYIWNFINDNYFEEIKDRLAHGATQESINNEDLVYIPILVPDDTILRKFATKVKELYQKKYINEIENEQLTQLRDFLLPLLMNGQVSVSSEH